MGERLNRFVATAGGIGYLPLAPGTWAAAISGVIWYLASMLFGKTISWQFALVTVSIIGGVIYSGRLSSKKDEDPAHVVIDEVAGMWVTLFLVPGSLINYVIGFVLFRFFDIVKPLGIRKTEKIKSGWGIMLDDILAGVYSNIILRLLILTRIW